MANGTEPDSAERRSRRELRFANGLAGIAAVGLATLAFALAAAVVTAIVTVLF